MLPAQRSRRTGVYGLIMLMYADAVLFNDRPVTEEVCNSFAIGLAAGRDVLMEQTSV